MRVRPISVLAMLCLGLPMAVRADYAPGRAAAKRERGAVARVTITARTPAFSSAGALAIMLPTPT